MTHPSSCDATTASKANDRASRWIGPEWLVVSASAFNALFVTLSLPALVFVGEPPARDIWSNELYAKGWLVALGLSVVGSIAAAFQLRWRWLQRLAIAAAVVEALWLGYAYVMLRAA